MPAPVKTTKRRARRNAATASLKWRGSDSMNFADTNRSFANITRYFATCARGLEPILAQELTGLRAEQISPSRGGVAFAGDRPLLYRANLWLRTAIRVLVPILEAPAASSDELYEAVRSLDW